LATDVEIKKANSAAKGDLASIPESTPAKLDPPPSGWLLSAQGLRILNYIEGYISRSFVSDSGVSQ